MIKKISLTIFTFFLCSYYQMTAQQFSYQKVFERINFFDDKAVDKDADGSPYIQSDYVLAKIGNEEVFYSVKYDAHLDQMEILQDGSRGHLPMMYEYVVEFYKEKKVYKVYSDDNKKGFFVMLTKGPEMQLLAKENVRYDEARPSNGMDPYKPARYTKTKSKFYVGYRNNLAERLSSKKKDFYPLFGEHSKEIQAFVKSNKLSLKSEEDLVQIFEHYNSL